MEAWGQLPEPGAICLDLFGNISNSRQLLQYAEHFGVADHIRLRGYVSDTQLDEALHSADFAINLRWPTMGEASASQLRLVRGRLAYRMLDRDLVTIIASMCENDNDTRLFRDAIEVAVATVQPEG
jgi:hypothetical protein